MQMKNPFTLISTINAMSTHDGFREGLYAKERDTRGWDKPMLGWTVVRNLFH